VVESGAVQASRDGPTEFCFLQGSAQPARLVGEIDISYDRVARSVSKPRRVARRQSSGPVRCKPSLLLSDNTNVCVRQFHRARRMESSFRIRVRWSMVKISGDWKRIGRSTTHEYNAIRKPTLFCSRRRSLASVVPDARKSSSCRVSEARALKLVAVKADRFCPEPNSGIEAVTLADGRTCLVYNPNQTQWASSVGKRGKLSLAVLATTVCNGRDVVRARGKKEMVNYYPRSFQSDDGMFTSLPWQRERIRLHARGSERLIRKPRNPCVGESL